MFDYQKRERERDIYNIQQFIVYRYCIIDIYRLYNKTLGDQGRNSHFCSPSLQVTRQWLHLSCGISLAATIGWSNPCLDVDNSSDGNEPNQSTSKTQKVQCGTSTSVCARLKSFSLLARKVCNRPKNEVFSRRKFGSWQCPQSPQRFKAHIRFQRYRGQSTGDDIRRCSLSPQQLEASPPASYKVEVAYR